MVIAGIDEHLIVTSSLKICVFLVCVVGRLAECSAKHGEGSTDFYYNFIKRLEDCTLENAIYKHVQLRK